MGWLDWLSGAKQPPEPPEIPASERLEPIDGPDAYEALLRRLGALSGLALRVRCHANGRAVVLDLERGADRFVHTQREWFADLETLLPVLNGWLAADEARRLVQYEDRGFGDALGVAFVLDEEIEALRDAGWRVLTRDRRRVAETSVEGIRLEGELTFHEDGAPRTGTLAEDTEIDGIPCAGGAPIELDLVKIGQKASRGTLLAATLARPVDLGDVTLPAGTRVDLYEEIATIAIATLAAATRVADLPLPAGTKLEFGEDGRLYTATLGAAIDVAAGSPYRGRALPADSMLSLVNGRWDLESVDVPEPPPPKAPSRAETRTLALDEIVGGYAFPAGTRVTTDDGALASATLPEDAVLDGVPCAAGFVGFTLGKLSSALLSDTVVRDGLVCRAGTLLLLWSDGALSEATLAEPAMVAGFELPAGSRVGFYEEIGNPIILIVPTEITLGGRACIPGQVFELDPDGRVERVGHITDRRHALTYAFRNDGDPYIGCA